MSRLPQVDLAIVSERKITHFLLCDSHRVGGAKFAFFKSFGFRTDAPGILAAALLAHAGTHEVTIVHTAPHGTKYEIIGPSQAPDGRLPIVTTVWIVLAGEAVPRLVTAVPD